MLELRTRDHIDEMSRDRIKVYARDVDSDALVCNAPVAGGCVVRSAVVRRLGYVSTSRRRGMGDGENLAPGKRFPVEEFDGTQYKI